MEVRPSRYVLAVFSVLALGAATLPAAAQQAGVGYDPQARGMTISSYQLDNLGTPYHRHPVDFTADPGAVGRNPDPYQLDLSDQAVRSAFERRYGPNTAGQRFKRWIGPGNEVKFLVREALAWHFANNPAMLGGGGTAGHNGEPTEVEVTDVQAFGDNEIWISYFQAALPGYSPERRLKVCDPEKPAGDSQERDPFWGIQVYFHNEYAPLAVSPQLPPHLVCGGKK